MNNIKRLLDNYRRQVSLPWSTNMAGKQRVWFAVYPPDDERRLRARLPDFETATLAANHGWLHVDLTRLLPEYLAAHKYREKIFEQPQHLRVGTDLEVRAAALISETCSHSDANSNCVVTVTGLASLFDFIRVSNLIERVEDSVHGRLLIFFPGEYTGNIYRFMDAREGFNYLAVPITSSENFINP